MAQFHNIFCVSDTPLATAEIAAWAGETWYGDGAPSFDMAFDDSPAWDRFEVGLPGVGQPLVLRHDTDPAVVGMHVGEAIEEAGGTLPPSLVSRLSSLCIVPFTALRRSGRFRVASATPSARLSMAMAS